DGFLDVAADVADGSTVIFKSFVDELDELFAALFRGRGDGNTHDLAVGGGIEAEVGGANGLVNERHGAGIPRRNHQHAGIGDSDVAKLIHGHERAVIIHADMIENGGVGAAGADTGEFLAKIVDSLFHANFCGGERFFGAGNCGHLCVLCEVRAGGIKDISYQISDISFK